ncbi:MAG: glycosyltransferase family 2 protein [Pseudomonadota bacterium]
MADTSPPCLDQAEPFDLVVSIINYRTAEMTLDCVTSVLADFEASDMTNAHVVVVDNKSDDGSVDVIQAWLAERPRAPVSFVASETNTGFSGGHNQGMATARGRYTLVLNSDALLRPGFSRTILEVADANPQAGLIAPQLEWEDGTVQTSCFRFHTPWSELIRGASTGPITKLLKRWDVPLEPPANPDQIEWVSFACILLRGDMVDQIGPMDEGYFLYFEDTEYSWRARQAGWGICHVPTARAVHFRGGSGPVKAKIAQKARLPRYFYESRTRYFRQTAGPLGPLLANLAWHLGHSVAVLRGLFGRARKVPIAHEARDIWTNLRQPLRPSDRGS